MTKKIKIPAKRGPKPRIITTLDAWVAKGKKSSGNSDTFRFTVDLPTELHRKMKAECAQRGVKMRDIVLGLLAREFPPDPPDAKTPMPSSDPEVPVPSMEALSQPDKF